MSKRLLNQFTYRFSIELENAYSLRYKVKDVVKMRGLQSQQPYVIIQNKRISIPFRKMLVDVINQSPFNKPNQPSNTVILDTELNYIHPTASTISILNKNFYLKIDNDLYYVANNQRFIKYSNNPEFAATDASESLEHILRSNLQSLDKLNEIRPVNLNTMIIKNVLDHSATFKIEKIRLKQLMKIISSRIEQFEQQIKIVDEDLAKKSIRKTRIFSTFIISQYALVHWLIYYHLSWDIMQPITVLLGNLDLLIGYYFFVFKGRNYTLQQIQKSIHEKHRFRYLKKYGVNIEKYEELLDLREYFQMRLDLYSKSPHILMERLEQRLKLLDTR